MTSRAFLPILALLAAGCGKAEEVRRYRAPKEPTWRMLGAIAPGKDATWFFKASGPSEHLGPRADEFVSFLRSLKLEEGEVRWTLPAGWTEEKGSGRDRLATLRFGPVEPKVEVSVVQFAGDGGGALANVNRWRGQMGLASIGAEGLDGAVRKIDAAGLQVLFADLTGPKRPAGRPAPMETPTAHPEEEGKPDLQQVRRLFAYELPAGWRDNPEPPNRGFERRVFEFRAGSGETEVMVTFSMYEGEMGGLAANLNRWRNQAGLPPVPDDQAAAWTRQVKFMDRDAWSTEAIGKDRAIVVIFQLHPQFSMFFKMDGTPAGVRAHREAFETLARSFRMERRGG